MSNIERINPFIKWAGGKRQLLDKLIPLMPESYGAYFEPFIGGGALLLAVQPENAVINDVNHQLLAGYRQIKDNPEELMAKMDEYDSKPCYKDEYYAYRNRFNEKIDENASDVETAALLIKLNRTNFNGLQRRNKSGHDNVPYGGEKRANTPSYDKDNITRLSEYLQHVTILEGDFADAVANATEGDFVYFDSPYVPETETASFTAYTKDGFGLEDHKRLAQLCRELDARGVKWMLSNNDVPLVHELYEGFNIISVSARRAINRDGNKRKGQEVIIRNYGTADDLDNLEN